MKRTDALYQSFVEILREELVPAMGCTEPIAIAYAAAQARAVLGKRPERVRIEVSGNIIKNVKSVVVPHTGSMHGIAAAAAAGIIAGREEKELEVLSEVTDEQIADMRAYLQEAAFDIRPIDSPFIFDIRITVYAAGDQASAMAILYEICRSKISCTSSGHSDCAKSTIRSTVRTLRSVRRSETVSLHGRSMRRFVPCSSCTRFVWLPTIRAEA